MASLKPLNNLYHKYIERNFELINISDRDSRKMIENFKKSHQVPLHLGGEAKTVFDIYHVSSCPTFYYSGNGGQITQVQ